MSEKHIRILSALLPSHADFHPILVRLREKYDLPEAGILDADYAELLMAEREIPWEKIRDELRRELEDVPDLWPGFMQNLIKSIRENPDAINDPDDFILQFNIEHEDVRLIMKGWF